MISVVSRARSSLRSPFVLLPSHRSLQVFVYFCIPETIGLSLENISVMMDLGVPTRAWKTYKIGDVQENFGQDEFRSSAKRSKMDRGMSYHVERAADKEEEEEVGTPGGRV